MELQGFELTMLWHKGWLTHKEALKGMDPIHPEYRLRQHSAQYCNMQFVIWRAIELQEDKLP